jgi:hypothetical protein
MLPNNEGQMMFLSCKPNSGIGWMWIPARIVVQELLCTFYGSLCVFVGDRLSEETYAAVGASRKTTVAVEARKEFGTLKI